MSVILLGDLHIGKGLSLGKTGIGSLLNSRVVDQMNLLEWVLEQAIENNCDRIIITGDVFEEPKPPTYLITLFISWLNKCSVNGISIDIVIGNHDILRSGNYYTSPLDIISECELDNCTVYKDINTITIGTTSFTFFPFRDRKSFSVESNAEAISLLKDMLTYEISSIPIPYTKILIGHFAIEGSILIGDEIDDLSNELFCSLDMFEGYDYVWMGHVHKPQIMRKSPLISHIGSMDISNFGETDHKKHIVIFDVENSSHRKIDIPTRNLSKICISVPKDTEDTTQYVLDEIKSKKITIDKSIVKLEISLSDPSLKTINRSEIEKYLYKEGVFSIAGFSESKKLSLIKRDKDGAENIDTTVSVISAIKLWADKKWPDVVDDLKKQKFIEAATIIHNDYKLAEK